MKEILSKMFILKKGLINSLNSTQSIQFLLFKRYERFVYLVVFQVDQSCLDLVEDQGPASKSAHYDSHSCA